MNDDAPGLELRDYLSILRRRRWIVLGVTLAVVVLAVIATLMQAPAYRATARVLVQPRSSDTLFNQTDTAIADQARAIQTEIQVVESRPVQQAAQTKIGTFEKISAVAVGQTNVIGISATNRKPARAAEIANAYAEAYINVRRQQNVDDLLAAVAQIQQKITDLDKQIAASDPKDVTRRKALEDQQNAFKAKLDETQVAASLQSGGVRLVNAASVPSAPYSPAPLRNAILALFLGGVIGTAVAFGFEYFDDSIKSSADLSRAVGNRVPIRGLIPSVPGWRNPDDAIIVSVADPTAPASEAYRALRTSIQFLHLDKPGRVIQVTSASEGDGKTTTLANLGVTLANADQKVMLVCADLRRPRLHEFFGLQNTAGFTSVVFGDVPLFDALQRVKRVPNLYLLSSGPLAPNPSEVLNSQRARELLDALSAQFDYVLVDCPPILPVTDAAVLSPYVDATIVVAKAGSTTRNEMARAVELLQQVDAPISGLVLNGVTEVGTYKHYRYEAHSGSRNGAAADNVTDVVL